MSVAGRARYRVRVFRIGWYGGAGGRLMRCCRRPHRGVQRAIPRPDPATGLLRLRWPVTDTVPVGRDWVSGYYVANLVLAAGFGAGRGTTIPFVVRAAPGRRAAILVQASVNTWQAYNQWGGRSLYTNHTGVGDDHVSFDRPYSQRGAPPHGGTQANLPQAWEFPLVRFLERYGSDVAYTTDVDTDRDPAELLRHRLVVTAGHGEYWTKAMRDGVERARAAGVNLAFMGANTGYWQMRYEDDRRTIVEYRTADRDPEPDPALKTIQFRELANPRPECTLMGVQWGELGNADYSPVGAAITPIDPWFARTGFRPTDVLEGLVGYEYDSIFDACPTPPLTRLFGASLPGHVDPSAVRYTAPSGARVFSSGSIRFAVGLDPLDGRGDPRLQLHAERARRPDALEGSAGLVAAARRADRDERHSIGAGDGAARRLRIEADERPLAHRDVLAVDAPVAGAAHDDADLFLARAALVVLEALGVRRKLEPVDAERLAAELAAHEPDAAARPRGVDLVDVYNAVAHTDGAYRAAILLRRMAVPKRKTSKARRDKRRAQHRIDAPRLSVCPQCHQPKRSHEMCPNCKTYRGREIEPLRAPAP